MERPYVNQELRRLVADRADRLLERQLLINRNKYPHPAVLRRMEENRIKEDG